MSLNNIEINKETVNGMDAINEAIEKNKDNKEVLSVAYDLFNKGINIELEQYSQIDENGKDKIKVILWNNLIENLSLVGSLKAGLSKFTNMFSNIGSMFSADEELSEESQEIGKGFIKVEGKLKGTPIGDLMSFLKEKIGEEKFKAIKEISLLKKENQKKLFNNIEGLENILTNGLKKGETLEKKIEDLPKSEKDFTKYVNETIKDTNNRGKTLGRYKKIGDKILGLAEKFGFKDSLVSMLDMLYKIPGIGPILKMLFAPKIKANFDKLGLNGPEGKSLANLKEFTNKKENKDILGFNPSDKIPNDSDNKELVDNPDKLKKEDLKTFYSKFSTYFENKIRKEGKITDENKIKKEAKKLTKKLITGDSFWSGILTGKKGEKLDKDLNKNEQILALIFKKLGGKEEIKVLDKSSFLSKLNSIDLSLLESNEEEIKKTKEINEKEAKEKEKIRLAKEVKYKKYNKNLEDFLNTNDNILNFKLEIKKEYKKSDTNNDTKDKNKKENEKLKENEINEKNFFDFYDKIEKYNNTLKPEDKKSEIKLDKDFWPYILTGENSSGTKVLENSILGLLYLEFKDKKSKKDFESTLKLITAEKIASLGLKKDIEDIKKISDEKKSVQNETLKQIDSKVKKPIKDPKIEEDMEQNKKQEEEKKVKLKEEIEKINKTLKKDKLTDKQNKLKLENIKYEKEDIKNKIKENNKKIKEFDEKILTLSNELKKDNFYLTSISNFFGNKTDEQEDLDIFKENKKKLQENNKELKDESEKIDEIIIKIETELIEIKTKIEDNTKEREKKESELEKLPPKMKKAK